MGREDLTLKSTRSSVRLAVHNWLNYFKAARTHEFIPLYLKSGLGADMVGWLGEPVYTRSRG